MASLLNVQNLPLLLFLIVPGFIAQRAFDLVIPTERRDFGNSFLDVISYSFVNLAIWFLPYFGLTGLQDNLPAAIFYPLFFLLIFVVVFLSPLAIAYWYYVARVEGFLRGTTMHPSPTAWDYFFDSGKIYWVKFYLTNGEQIGGFYGKNSFVSTFPNMQQIYVEELYALEEDGSFKQESLEGTNGAIINRENCDYIEFLAVQETATQAEVTQVPTQEDSPDRNFWQTIGERLKVWIREGPRKIRAILRLLAGAPG